MQRPLISLAIAIVLLLLGGSLMAPVSGVNPVVARDGSLMRTPDGRPVMERDPYEELRVNWPAYVVLAAGGVSFAWSLILVGCGVVLLTKSAIKPSPRPNHSVEATADPPRS